MENLQSKIIAIIILLHSLTQFNVINSLTIKLSNCEYVCVNMYMHEYIQCMSFLSCI